MTERRLSKSGDSLYILLGIPKTSTVDEIKKAYRSQALKCHPDKNKGDENATERFKQINHANAILTDDTKRQIYNKYGSMGLYMAEQMGEERFKAYMLAENPCIKALCVIACLFTGCCCCCCCCCCFGFCCGKCTPKQPEYEETPMDDLNEYDPDNQVITEQPEKTTPIATPPPGNGPIPMAPPDNGPIPMPPPDNGPIAMPPPDNGPIAMPPPSQAEF